MPNFKNTKPESWFNKKAGMLWPQSDLLQMATCCWASILHSFAWLFSHTGTILSLAISFSRQVVVDCKHWHGKVNVVDKMSLYFLILFSYPFLSYHSKKHIQMSYLTDVFIQWYSLLLLYTAIINEDISLEGKAYQLKVHVNQYNCLPEIFCEFQWKSFVFCQVSVWIYQRTSEFLYFLCSD